MASHQPPENPSHDVNLCGALWQISGSATRGATGGLFAEFVRCVKTYYVKTYGLDSPQVKTCSYGWHLESSAAARIFEQMALLFSVFRPPHPCRGKKARN